MTARAEAAMDVDADGELPTAPPVASSDGRSSEKACRGGRSDSAALCCWQEWILVDDAEKTGQLPGLAWICEQQVDCPLTARNVWS